MRREAWGGMQERIEPRAMNDAVLLTVHGSRPGGQG